MKNDTFLTPQDLKELALGSIEYVQNLLDKFKKDLLSSPEILYAFSETEINDLADILGFTYDEIVELLSNRNIRKNKKEE